MFVLTERRQSMPPDKFIVPRSPLASPQADKTSPNYSSET